MSHFDLSHTNAAGEIVSSDVSLLTVVGLPVSEGHTRSCLWTCCNWDRYSPIRPRNKIVTRLRPLRCDVTWKCHTPPLKGTKQTFLPPVEVSMAPGGSVVPRELRHNMLTVFVCCSLYCLKSNDIELRRCVPGLLWTPAMTVSRFWVVVLQVCIPLVSYVLSQSDDIVACR